ncbi:MAG: tetratricopeptide repeat protein [Terriglobales bacterium]
MPKIDRQAWWICTGLVIAVCIFYYPVVHNDFIYDDDTYIVNNMQVKAGLTWSTMGWAFTTFDEANWHPVTWLSHALDCQIFGLNPVGPHVENVLLHAANAVVLFLLLQNATGFRWRSLMVAALFALHAINVESVAWAAERKNELSMLLCLLAFCAYVWYTRERGALRYGVVAGFYALALMAKPQVITFPFLLLLWDYWPLCRLDVRGSLHPKTGNRDSSKLPLGTLILEKLPLLLLSAASAVITLIAQQAGGAVRSLSQYGFRLRVETAAISYARYLGKAFWPTKLAAMYPHPSRFYPGWQVAGSLFLLLLITLLVLWARERRYLVVGWFWFLGSLVPMIGLVQVGEQALADRYAYISFIGLFVMMVWLIADTTEARHLPARWLAVPAVACLATLGILTCRQVGYWHDAESFWVRTIALTTDNYVAEANLAALLHAQGRSEEALAHLRVSLAIRPDNGLGNIVLGDEELKRGNWAAAIERYQTAALSPSKPAVRARAYSLLGGAYLSMGQPQKAKASYEASLQLQPNQHGALATLGLMAAREGDFPRAATEFSRALAVKPNDVGYLLLADVLQKQGRTSEADVALQRARRISKNLAQAEAQADALLAGK